MLQTYNIAKAPTSQTSNTQPTSTNRALSSLSSLGTPSSGSMASMLALISQMIQQAQGGNTQDNTGTANGNDGNTTSTPTPTPSTRGGGRPVRPGPAPAPINNGPTANNDSTTAISGTPVTLNVLANDTDPDRNDTLSITGFTNPANGTIRQEGNNLIYTPNADFVGADAFSYTINDGRGGVSRATATITVKPPTTAVADQVSTQEDTQKSFNVLTNDIGEGLTLVGVTHETPALQNEFEARGGTLSFNADGTVNYKGMTDYYGNDKLVYTMRDADGNTHTQAVDVIIDSVADSSMGAGRIYHPSSWIYSPNNNPYDVSRYGHKLSIADLGGVNNIAKDQLQQFSNYNQDLVGTQGSIVVSGVSTFLRYNGEELDFSNGQTHEIPLDDIRAGRLVAEFNGAGHHTTVEYNYKAPSTEALGNDNSATIHTPIAFDLNGDGKIGVTGATSSFEKDADAAIGRTVEFDMDGDGKTETMEWFDGSGDGILIDNRDGKAATDMNGLRLFGDHGGTFSNGYEKLGTFDGNGDGQLTDAELNGLELWVDDGDGIVEEGEIQSLNEHNIAAISTQMELVEDEDGKQLMQSSATTTDGKFIKTEDVWFQGE